MRPHLLAVSACARDSRNAHSTSWSLRAFEGTKMVVTVCAGSPCAPVVLYRTWYVVMPIGDTGTVSAIAPATVRLALRPMSGRARQVHGQDGAVRSVLPS